MTDSREVFISVDVETSGPIPGEYSLLAIGACNAYDPMQTFECALKPTTCKVDAEALKAAGLSLDTFESEGLAPTAAMRAFHDWICLTIGVDGTPVFVGFNAGFDWSFVNYYFHHFLGKNPFGFAPLDVKSLYMGAAKTSWDQTRSSQMAAVLKPSRRSDHNALHDALYQAELFRAIRKMSA